jgi:RNA polymerase sigma-70 factor (ECF subfamily)
MEAHGEKYHIDRIKKGDKQAFKWVVERYRDMVYTICKRMLVNEADAMEAAQDVFLKAFRAVGTFQGKAKFSTWLYRITYNQCISVIRRKVRVIDLVDEIPEGEISENDINGLEMITVEERRNYLQMALEALPETDSVVVTLFYLEELSLEEIAKITGMTSGNIRIKLHRARKMMYHVISEHLKSEVNSIL